MNYFVEEYLKSSVVLSFDHDWDWYGINKQECHGVFETETMQASYKIQYSGQRVWSGESRELPNEVSEEKVVYEYEIKLHDMDGNFVDITEEEHELLIGNTEVVHS